MDDIKKLEDKIKYHKALYYQGIPEITDIEYDKLEDKLRSLDPKNSALDLVGSITTNKGKIKHKTKMLSLDKTYAYDDLVQWVGKEKVVSTYKIDGVSCSLIYKNGTLITAKTRGDGVHGENILEKVQWINSIPKKLKKSVNSEVEIRGEIYCFENKFYQLSDKMTEMELDRPSSQRNIVAGFLGRKDHIELCRYLDFLAFDFIEEELKLKEEREKVEFLKSEDFLVPKTRFIENATGLQEVLEEVREFMNEGKYQVDGVVFTYNDLIKNKDLGVTAHHPRYKMAFKFAGESKETTIESITWQVSRNGILTPVAGVSVVELSGANISRVTLHNFGLVKHHELKVGDKIEIIRSGEVIPKFLSVIESSKGSFVIPEECPECESELVEEDIRLVCNNKDCDGQIYEKILYFIQKVGIEDLSTKRLEEMIRVGLIKKIPDLYKLELEDFLILDKVKDKLANKMFSEIQKSKDVDLIIFLGALGIKGGANNKCEKIIRAGHNSMAKILELTIETLCEVELFAERSSTEFLNSLNTKHDLIQDLKDVGFKLSDIKIDRSNYGELENKKICITGTLTRPRVEIKKMITSVGGKVVTSVSKNTDYLLTNEKDSSSSKSKKAKELGVKIIDEDELYQITNI